MSDDDEDAVLKKIAKTRLEAPPKPKWDTTLTDLFDDIFGVKFFGKTLNEVREEEGLPPIKDDD